MRYLMLLTCCLLAPHMRGQEVVRFDTVQINGAGSFAIGHSVFESDTGVFDVFSIQKGLAGESQDVYFGRFDATGGLFQEATVETYRQDWVGRYGAVLKGAQGYYAGVARFGVSEALDSLFLYRYSPEGDTVWTRFIASDTTYFMRGASFTSDSTILITGTHEQPREAYIYEVDTLGNVLGFHTYPGFYPEDVTVGADGAWYVTGQGFQPGNQNRAVLIRSSAGGEEMWRRTDPLFSNHYQLIPTADTCVVALGVRADGSTPSRAKVVKYDRYGTQQWLREPYEADFDGVQCYLHAGFENPDGTFIVAGQVRDTTYGQAGMLFKLDSEGNTIWQRFYAHYPSFLINDDQIFNDVKRTSDGGLILTGETNGGEHPYAQLWLLKLDSAGCLVPGCGSVGVEECTDLFQGQLQVWPNPASERVQVSLTLPEGFATRGAVQLYFLDVQGRIVGQQAAQQNFNVITGARELSAHPSGTYYLHMADSKRWLAGGKLVVE